MGLLFAVDGHIHIDDVGILPLGEFRHHHRGAVGDLPVQGQKELFPHDLRADLLFRLIGDDVVREELGSFNSEFGEHCKQLLDALPRLRGDGHDVRKIIRLAVGGDHGKQVFFVRHGVGLVDDEHSRHIVFPQLCDERLLLRPQ